MNSFGRIFRIHILGESHGRMVGVLIDGCPAGMPLDEKDFLPDLNRRRPGAAGTTPRKDNDTPAMASGVFNGKTTGAPLLVSFENRDVRPDDYARFMEIPRPGHADFVALKKFGGHADYRGGGHFSGRLTLGLVAAGVVAKKLMPELRIAARLTEAGGQKNIDAAVKNALEKNDSIGGVVECRVAGLPVGLGEPFFDSLESVISHIMFSIPAVKGIEFGSGFAATRMKGSEHNDPIVSPDGTTQTNHAGGINGGLSNGNELVLRLAVKPTSSTAQVQETLSLKTGKPAELKIEGRHDTCIALRVPVVAEAALAVALADMFMLSGLIPPVWTHENRKNTK